MLFFMDTPKEEKEKGERERGPHNIAVQSSRANISIDVPLII